MEHLIHNSLTWYDTEAGQAEAFKQLSSHRNVDCCVIGGGLAGLTTALELSRAGQSVVLLEADRLAGGASGRNGGFVSSGFSEGSETIFKAVGSDLARSLHALSCEGREYVRATIAKHDPEIKMGDGMVVMQRHADQGRLLAYRDFLFSTMGEELTFLDANAIRAHLDSDVYKAGLFSPSAFHIDPLRYARLLARTRNSCRCRNPRNEHGASC